jgi:hypothetical protein
MEETSLVPQEKTHRQQEMSLGRQARTRRRRKTSHDPQGEPLFLSNKTLGREETSLDQGKMTRFRQD